MPHRTLLPLDLTFRVMDGLRRDRPQRTVNYGGSQINIKMYTAVPDGYDGPEVMVCMRPVEAWKKSAPEPEEPEALHVYLRPSLNNVNKKAHVPKGKEGDLYLLDLITGQLEELEADGKDGSELLLRDCSAKITEHLDLGDDADQVAGRLDPLLKCAKDKLAAAKIDALEWELKEFKAETEEAQDEMRAEINANSNRIDNVEENVDDLQARVTRLEMDDKPSCRFLFQAPSDIVPESLQRHWRAARVQQLSKPEAETLNHYAKEGFIKINGALRATTGPNAVALPPAIRKKKDIIERALSKIGKCYVGRVYRAVDMPADWVLDIKTQIHARARGHRLKIPFSDAAFLSTASRLSGSFKLKNCRFVIQSKTGAEIAAYSNHPGEHEVQFSPGTKFTIFDAMEFDNGILFVRMQED